MADGIGKENKPSKKNIKTRLSLAGAIGAVLGIGAEKVAEVTFKTYELRVKSEQFDSQMLADNVERVIELWSKNDGDLIDKVTFTGILIESDLVPEESMCAITALALRSDIDAQSRISQILIDTISADKISKNMKKDSCNLYDYEKNAKDTGEIISQSAPNNNKEKLTCPEGLLYTQFGNKEQKAFGISMKGKGKSYTITSPEIISGFNADKIVIRYFSEDSEEFANNWARFISKPISDFEINTKFFDGFESINPKQFELWWPANINTPDTWKKPTCKLSEK